MSFLETGAALVAVRAPVPGRRALHGGGPLDTVVAPAAAPAAAPTADGAGARRAFAQQPSIVESMVARRAGCCVPNAPVCLAGCCGPQPPPPGENGGGRGTKRSLEEDPLARAWEGDWAKTSAAGGG